MSEPILSRVSVMFKQSGVPGGPSPTIRIPANSRIEPVHNGLPSKPDGQRTIVNLITERIVFFKFTLGLVLSGDGHLDLVKN